MQQDLVSMQITREQQAEVLALIAQVIQKLPGMITLPPDTRRSMRMMGPGSEHYARLAFLGMEQNPEIIPRGLDIAQAKGDLEALDALLPILKAAQQLVDLLEDTAAGLGSDIMVVANIAYGLMKSVGKSTPGLDDIVKELSYRHARKRRKKPTPESETE